MPPKTTTKQKKAGAKDAKLKKKVQEKRSRKMKAFPAQTISELNAVRGRLIATQLGIKNSSKYSFPSELVPLIKDKMALITDCLKCGAPANPTLTSSLRSIRSRRMMARSLRKKKRKRSLTPTLLWSLKGWI